MVEDRLKKLPDNWTGDDRARAIIDTKTKDTCKTCDRNGGEYGCFIWECDVLPSQTCYMHIRDKDD